MSERTQITDDVLAATDVEALLRDGLAQPGTEAFRLLFSDGAVGAAIRADRLAVQPRSLTFLAEIVRRGGAAYAAGLPEPMPTPAQTELVAPWLAAAGEHTEVALARWLDAVAAIVELREVARATGR